MFDCFPDGRRVLGGAPFNVAWHLQGFGLQPLMITRVGEDDPAADVLARMEAWGMDTRGVQRDPRHPTGTVRVDLQEGQPTFTITAGQSYDHIAAAELPEVDRTAVLLYHGSLALREERPRAALEVLRGRASLPVFLDVNLREPWWTREGVLDMIAHATWLKCNEEELRQLSGRAISKEQDVLDAARAFREEHGLAWLVVTRGGDGAVSVDEQGGVESTPAAPVGNLVDTVGAGDGFSAVCAAGLLQGWPTAVTLRRAGRFASSVCGFRGATADDHSLYQTHRETWSAERDG